MQSLFSWRLRFNDDSLTVIESDFEAVDNPSAKYKFITHEYHPKSGDRRSAQDLNLTNINGDTYNAPIGHYEIYTPMSLAKVFSPVALWNNEISCKTSVYES